MKKVVTVFLILTLIVVVPTSGAILVHEWKFEGDTLDSSGNGNDGVATGSATYVNGAKGQAITLDAGESVDAAAGTTSNIPILGTESWSMNMWLALDTEIGNLANLGGFGGRTNGAGGSRRSYLAFEGSDGNDYYFWGLNDGNGQDVSFSPAEYIADSEWHMYTITFNGTTLIGYVDGVAVGSGTPGLVDTEDSVHIGGTSLWDITFTGAFDEFTIWNGALTQDEIDMLFSLTPRSVNVFPVNGEKGISSTDVLRWKAPRDQDDLSIPDSRTASFIVYCDPNETMVRNATYDNHEGILYFSDQVFSGNIVDDPEQVFDPAPDLDINTTYYWRVDTRHNDGSDIVRGSVWVFNTDAKPLINQEPSDQLVDDSENAIFTVVASDPTNSGLSFQWYRDPDPTVTDDEIVLTGETVDALEISAPLESGDQGFYSCKVTNSGGDTWTRSARLTIKDLVNHWAMDGDAVDSEGGYDGIVIDPNLVSWEAGQVGTGSISLESNNGVTVTLDENYPTSGSQLTVMAWVYAESKPGWASILKNWADSTNGMIHFGLDSAGNALDLWMTQADSVQFNVNEGVAFPTGLWQHVIAVADGSKIRLYRNGIEVGIAADYDGTLKTEIPYIGIGYKPGDDGSISTSPGFWNGKIDDVKVYNYGLTPEAIAQAYYDVTGTGVCLYQPVHGDVNNDCVVDLVDIALMASEWMDCGLFPITACQ